MSGTRIAQIFPLLLRVDFTLLCFISPESFLFEFVQSLLNKVSFVDSNILLSEISFVLVSLNTRLTIFYQISLANICIFEPQALQNISLRLEITEGLNIVD